MPNALYYGDNLDVLRNREHFPDGSIDLIYLDPPKMETKGRYLLIALWAVCLVFLVGCDEKSEDAKKKAAAAHAQQAAEEQLMADPARAATELKRRLRESIRFLDGLITVNGQFGLVEFVLPANAPWVLSCGVVGMKVAFGGGGSDASGGAELRLTFDPIEKIGCATLGPVIAKEIQAILAGR